MTVTFSDWITEIANWVFLAIALATLAGAFLVVTAKNVVRAVLALVVTFAGTAALFLMLGAEFVGWTVVLVYIGAVIILFLIGIMITRAPLGMETELSHSNQTKIGAALVSGALFALITVTTIAGFGETKITPNPTRTGEIGQSMFERFVIPFEVVSIVLLAALIGGIVLARQDPVEGDEALR